VKPADEKRINTERIHGNDRIRARRTSNSDASRLTRHSGHLSSSANCASDAQEHACYARKNVNEQHRCKTVSEEIPKKSRKQQQSQEKNDVSETSTVCRQLQLEPSPPIAHRSTAANSVEAVASTQSTCSMPPRYCDSRGRRPTCAAQPRRQRPALSPSSSLQWREDR
jgi:hypothetical protein